MRFPDEVIQFLSPWFYRTDRRDDGLWHLIRDPDNGWWVANQLVNVGATYTTANVLGVRQVPLDAKGVIYSCAFNSTVAGGYMLACEGTRNPDTTSDMPLGETHVAGRWARQWVAVLFGITAGVPDGTVRFGAFGQNCRLWIAPIGYIA